MPRAFVPNCPARLSLLETVYGPQNALERPAGNIFDLR